MTVLTVENLSAGYGKAEVLHGVTLSVDAARIVAIVGPNGAGKSTLMHAVMGLLPRRGQVSLLGQEAGDVGWMVRRGVVLVPEARALFTDMSVEDNLLLGGFSRWRQGGRQTPRDLAASMADVFGVFRVWRPRWRMCSGCSASGGLDGGCVRGVSASGGAAPAAGRDAIRRRAADVGAGAGADGAAETAAAG